MNLCSSWLDVFLIGEYFKFQSLETHYKKSLQPVLHTVNQPTSEQRKDLGTRLHYRNIPHLFLQVYI